jgi:hypothetical protein
MVSLFLRLGERDRNEEIDFVGLVGRDANAFGNDGGSVFLYIVSMSCVFDVR